MFSGQPQGEVGFLLVLAGPTAAGSPFEVLFLDTFEVCLGLFAPAQLIE
jgi:hypothetical protein